MPKMSQLTSTETAAIELFALNAADIQHISTQTRDGLTMIEVTLVPDYPKCPRCGEENPRIINYVTKTITHSILQEQKCLLIYNARRYRCRCCNRTYYENNPFVFGKMRISARTTEDALHCLKDPAATFSGVAKRYGISAATLQNLFDERVQFPPASHLPRVLLLDETYSFKSDNSKYVCMLLDYDTARPVDLLDNRKKESLLAYFRKFPKSEREKVKYVAADMYVVYRDVCRTVFPKAVYAVDRFHVMQEFTRKMTAVRVRVMKGARSGSDEYYLLKKQNSLLNIRPDARRKASEKEKQLTKEDYIQVLDPYCERAWNPHFKKWLNNYELLNLLLDISDELRKSYEFRNRMSSFFRECTLETAGEELKSLVRDMDASGIPEMIHFAETVKTWFPEIVNSFHIIGEEYVTRKDGSVKLKSHRLTSSLIENRNKIVQQIKNNANGYTNWNRFRNRVMYVLTNLDPVKKRNNSRK